MPARFFADETDLWLAKELAARRDDVVYPGCTDLPDVPRGTVDDEWLPIVGRMGLVVVTRDRRIRYRPVERRLWVMHEVRGFALTGTRSQSTAESLAVIERKWKAIESVIAERSGPWMYALTTDGLRNIPLD